MWVVCEVPTATMSETINCRVCEWSGEKADLRTPPTGEEVYYCPECATSIDP